MKPPKKEHDTLHGDNSNSVTWALSLVAERLSSFQRFKKICISYSIMYHKKREVLGHANNFVHCIELYRF